MTTLHELHRIATHVLSRARAVPTGFVSLRVSPNGIATPSFGSTSRRVRLSGVALLVEDDADDGATLRAAPLAGSSLAALAAVAAVDLDAPFAGGADAPAIGDREAPIDVADDELSAVFGWFGLAQSALDGAVVELAGQVRAVTPPRLWPEHFDVAVEVHLENGRGVNLGASPGDATSAEPYLYVGPWGPERPGESAFWNAPFGAVRARGEVEDAPAATGFFLDGIRRLS